jgi:hypothetical protein
LGGVDEFGVLAYGQELAVTLGEVLAGAYLIHHTMGDSEKDEEETIRKAVDFSTTTRRQIVEWSGPTLRKALLGKEIGTRKSILPVVVSRFRRTPHMVLSGAFLALTAPDFNGWPCRWALGQQREWDPGRIWRMPA